MLLFGRSITAGVIMAIMALPRFDYESSCSYEFDPSPSFGSRCSWDTSTVSSASSGSSD